MFDLWRALLAVLAITAVLATGVPPDPQSAGCGMDPNGGGSACGRGDDPPTGGTGGRGGSGG